jgi:hypothetical protein
MLGTLPECERTIKGPNTGNLRDISTGDQIGATNHHLEAL